MSLNCNFYVLLWLFVKQVRRTFACFYTLSASPRLREFFSARVFLSIDGHFKTERVYQLPQALLCGTPQLT